MGTIHKHSTQSRNLRYNYVSRVWSDCSSVKMIDINKNILVNLSEDSCDFDEFVNVYARIYDNSMSGHKRIEEITSKFGGDWKDVVFNVDSQDYFLFVAQVAYEHKLVDWALRLRNVDGSLENAYQETMFNPARYCAYMESLECVNNVVEVLCENIVLFTEFVYYTEFFEMTCLSYLKHILNVLLN